MKLISLLLCGVCLPCLAAEAPLSPAVVVTKENVGVFYRGFVRLNKEPHSVSPALARLCIMPRKEMLDAERAQKGPHALAYVNLYVNPAANETLQKNAPTFAPGAVIIKEKLGVDKASHQTITGIGGMIKREAGFDPANGDWEYFYSSEESGFAVGKLQNCAECHAGAKAADFVFSVRQPQ